MGDGPAGDGLGPVPVAGVGEAAAQAAMGEARAMKRPTKAECRRAVELATRAELQRFLDIAKIQTLAEIFDCQDSFDASAREATSLVRKILARGRPGR